MRPRRLALFVNRLGRSSHGASAVELGLIAALAAVAALTAMTGLGVDLGAAFHNSSTNRKVI
ncbi:Flp family type IVb pilin [Sphingomonas sp. MAH-20]|uniref:Flp family type IVb pilin n=1 Tax=Sphingomonas horti TaxID=2682842 RepID=A0A6I4J0B8_9SPHN|nr:MULTISPECIES: Flp family type IVb pilin [Sphingomonas]MBA2919994.1 Flp family type IVb pilin [Sphingomonas sp. CGMCC 1.13658]MVO77875.1 Flp family type IVb pilin [Sphingomonas horti]